MDAEDVRKSLESRRRAALENAREGMTDAVRDRVNAQVHALTLVLRDLGLESEDGRRLTPQPPSPTVDYVRRFAGQMEAMLEANREKGDRAGWRAATPVDLVNGAARNLGMLAAMLHQGAANGGEYDHAAIARRAANVANFCMMVADRCGALVLPGEESTPALEPLFGAEIGDVEPQGECNAEMFAKGQSLVALDSRSAPAQAWVERVAQESGQRVDWHYSGGVAHVLVLGDHAKAMEAAKRLAPDLGGTVLRWFDADELGCYRAGVTSVPDDVVAVDVVGSL